MHDGYDLWVDFASMTDDGTLWTLVHHYFDIDLDVLWSTVTEDLPGLLRTLPPDP